jgi:hypothetical protein
MAFDPSHKLEKAISGIAAASERIAARFSSGILSRSITRSGRQ